MLAEEECIGAWAKGYVLAGEWHMGHGPRPMGLAGEWHMVGMGQGPWFLAEGGGTWVHEPRPMVYG